MQLATKYGFQAELARKMGVSPGLIQSYVKGERTPGLDQLDKFAAALGRHPWDLIRPETVPTTRRDRLAAKIVEVPEQDLPALEHILDTFISRPPTPTAPTATKNTRK